jgi:hypothetical protein
MWLKERPFLGSPGGIACRAFTARAGRRFTRQPYWPPSSAALRDRGSGAKDKSGMRPAAQGRPWPPSNAALRDRGSGTKDKSGMRPATQGRPLAPEQCCPAGSRLGSQGQERYAPSCARSPYRPPSSAALRDRGSGAKDKSGMRPAAQGCTKIKL